MLINYKNSCRIINEHDGTNEQIDAAKSIKVAVESYIEKCPLRIQYIIRYKYIDNMTWEDVGKKFNRSGESVRKEYQRFRKSSI